MAVPPEHTPLLVAVDTNFLLDLAIERPNPQRAVAYIRKKKPGAVIMVPPTVLDELAHLLETGGPGEKIAAGFTLQSLRSVWKMHPVDLIPVGHGIVECIADKIRDRGFIPQAERNDSLILAEAALLDCKLLLSSDDHLLKANSPALAALLTVQHDVGCPVIVSPYQVAKLL